MLKHVMSALLIIAILPLLSSGSHTDTYRTYKSSLPKFYKAACAGRFSYADTKFNMGTYDILAWDKVCGITCTIEVLGTIPAYQQAADELARLMFYDNSGQPPIAEMQYIVDQYEIDDITVDMLLECLNYCL